jgi:hypothetical protein
LAKRSKIIYTENPNDVKGAPIPHIGIYSDHQLVCKYFIISLINFVHFIDKLKWEQKEASIPRKTELHECPNLLKLMANSSISKTGEANAP